MIKKYIILISAVIASMMYVNSYGAEGQVTGKVTRVAFNLSNRAAISSTDEAQAHIYIEGLPNACGSGEARVVISSRNPLYNSVVSAVLIAQARGSRVTAIYFDVCTIRESSWDLQLLESLAN